MAHPRTGRGLVRSRGPDNENTSLVEIVREVHEQVERGGVRPVNVLEHEQNRSLVGTVGEQRERQLEYTEPASDQPVLASQLSERRQSLDERLVRQLGTDEVDRAAGQDVEAIRPCAVRQLRGHPRLPDAGVAEQEDAAAVSFFHGVEAALELG